jgi:hypothetical protein
MRISQLRAPSSIDQDAVNENDTLDGSFRQRSHRDAEQSSSEARSK